MIDDLAVATTSVPLNTETWYDEDTVIPYLMTFRAKQSRPLDRADIARWMKSPAVVA